jgi:hypothetical protein
MKTIRSIITIGAMAALILMVSPEARAQLIQLAPTIGYQTGTNLKAKVGSLHVEDGMAFGAVCSIGVGGGRFAEISYNRTATELSIDQGPGYTPISHLGINVYSLGLRQDILPAEKISPFGLLNFGILTYNPADSKISVEKQMHISLAGGARVQLSKLISLRFQARLILPIYSEGMYFTSGVDNSGYAIPQGIHGVQADVTGGIMFAIR